MVVDICHRCAGLSTTVVSRNSGREYHQGMREQGNYSIIFDDDPASATRLAPPIRWYESNDDPQISTLLASPSVTLVTTSVRKENLREASSLIAHAIEKRVANNVAGHLCVIACENLPQNSTELCKVVTAQLTPQARTYSRGHVLFCNTLVDRVCAKVRYQSGRTEVPVESFHHWVVEKPEVDIEPIVRLAAMGLITIADPGAEFKAYEVQKYWCMNGLHLAAAAYIYNYGSVRHFADALTIDPLFKKVLALQRELESAFRLYVKRVGLQSRFPNRSVRQYSDSVFYRLRRNRTDTVGRILKQEEEAPESVIQVLDRIERLVEPQCEILAFNKVLIDPKMELVALHLDPPQGIRRLQLDDAVQQVVLAMRRYAREYSGSADE